ncbi:MAG TPA: flagellar basal-body rod protein FlgF [Rhizomicrobium sp.]|jgi:flagellar basal-body rod protein FlgF
MDNTLLINLSQQVAAMQTMDVIANNLANMSTPGFKRDEMQFSEYLAQARPAEGEGDQHTLSFVEEAGVARDLTGGPIQVTNAPFDFAVEGKGYFVVQTPEGERYTRNGHFTLDPQGRLVTDGGYSVQGEGGDITVTQTDGDVHVAHDGTISGLNGQIGKLKLAAFDDERALLREGSSLYSSQRPPLPTTPVKIEQGAIEGSNVAPVVEISKMIEVMRSYQATMALSQSQEDLKRGAVDKLAQFQS